MINASVRKVMDLCDGYSLPCDSMLYDSNSKIHGAFESDALAMSFQGSRDSRATSHRCDMLSDAG